MKDPEIFNLIEAEHQRQLRGIELIASENFVSNEVMQAMGSWLTNKYAEDTLATATTEAALSLTKPKVLL